MNPSAFFIRRPVATILLTIGIALAGVASYFALPVSALPSVDFPTIGVSAALPGASPDIMATSVATPLERRLGQIANVSEMTSSSSTQRTQVVLQFGLDRNIDGAARDVQAAINASRADLPATLRSNPTYRKFNPADQPIMILAITSPTLTKSQMYDAAATILQQKLSQVKGIGSVDIGGGASPGVRVEVNPTAAARYGIALEDIRAAIAGFNTNQPKGAIEAGGRRLQIYANDEGRTAADYQGLLVAYRNGAGVRLSDLAEVKDGAEDERNLGLFNGQTAMVVQLRREPGANVVATVDRVNALLPELREALPKSVDLSVANDTTNSIRASLTEVERTLLIATALVVLVVLVFLRSGRATLIPGVAVVVSLLGTLAVMFFFGFSLDNLSLMALTVATGFVVDDAIVVLENITRHVEDGMGRFEAALLGAREVGFTVVSMSISLIAVFLPILLMGGIVGRMFREFAVVLSSSILISLVLALTATPMMAARLISVDHGRPGRRPGPFRRLSDGLERGFEHVLKAYEKSLAWALRHGILMLLILAATIVLNVYLYIAAPKGFFPQQDTGTLIGGIRADQTISFQAMSDKLARIVKIIKRDPAVNTVTAFIGGGRTNGGFMFIQLKPRAERGASPAPTAWYWPFSHPITGDEVNQRLRPKLFRVEGAQAFLQSAQDIRVGGRQGNAQYQYTIMSDDLNALRTWSQKLADALKRRPADLTDVDSDQQEKGLEAYVTVDRQAAARLGLTNTVIDSALYDAFGQRQVSTIYNSVNQYHVIMEVPQEFRGGPESLKEIYVSPSNGTQAALNAATVGPAGLEAETSGSTTTAIAAAAVGVAGSGTGAAPGQTATGASSASVGAALSGAGVQRTTTGGGASGQAQTGSAVSTSASTMIPLSAFATWQLSSTPLEVDHQDGQVATTISFNLPPGHALSDAEVVIHQVEAEIHMPANVRGSFQGTAAMFTDSLKTQPLLIAAALLAVYGVLGILYESYIHPLTVLSTLPSAGVGAVAALMLFKIEFDIIALIGVILLIGIVKKNAILIIDFALVAERERGLSSRDAIYEACLLRFRPILMTTVAAILGALPLAFGLGEGGEIRRPLGVAIIGGLIVSQLLTLLTTPVVYLYLDKLRGRGRRRASIAQRAFSPGPTPLPAE